MTMQPRNRPTGADRDAHPAQARSAAAVAVGLDDYVAKPIHIEVVVQALLQAATRSLA